MNATIQTWGNSAAVRIPKWALEESGLSQGEHAKISARKNVITIEKSSEITLQSLFKDYHGDYTPEEYDWGKPQGKEVW